MAGLARREIEEWIMFALLKQSDARQVRKVLAGQRQAFGPLVERHLPAVYAVAFARTGNHADAEDVAQEAFLAAFQSLHTLREPGKFEGWVVAIARRAAAKLRERRPQNEASGAGAMDEMTYPDPARQELRRLLREEIERLEDEPREVLLLHYFAGLSAGEIAGTLDITREAAKKRLQRARQTLSERLLAVVGDETPPDSAYQKQRTAIMGIVGATAVAWGSGAEAAGVGGVWPWVPGGGLGVGVVVTGALVAAAGAVYLLAGGGEAAETAALGSVPDTIAGEVEATLETAIDEMDVAGGAVASAPMEAADPGPIPALAGLWKVCVNLDNLKGSFGPGGDFVYLEQSDATFTLHGTDSEGGMGEAIASGQLDGDAVTIALATRDGESILTGAVDEDDILRVSGVIPATWELIPLDVSLTRLSDPEVAEVEIWQRRHREMRELVLALGAFRDENNGTLPDRLEVLGSHLKNPQLAVSGGSRVVEYQPTPGPGAVDTSAYPPELSVAERFFRLEEDTLRAWPDFPSFPPMLRIRYTSPPMVLHSMRIDPNRVRRADRGNRLQCPESRKGLPEGEVSALIASCQNNMKQLGLVIKMFQNESQRGHSPAGWAMTVPEYLLDTMVLTCPGLGEADGPGRTVSYEMLFPTLNDRGLLELAEEWGMETSNLGPIQTQVPAIVETHDCADGKSRNVVYWDGHAERLNASRWQAEIVPYLPMADALRNGSLLERPTAEAAQP